MSSRPVKPQEVIKIDGDAEYTQHMYATQAGDGADQDAITSITVHHDAYLMGISLECRCSLVANNDYFIIELSKSGNYQADENDNPDTLLVMAQHFSLVTDGASAVGRGKEFRTKIFFRAGERIYLNQNVTSGKTAVSFATFYWRNL